MSFPRFGDHRVEMVRTSPAICEFCGKLLSVGKKIINVDIIYSYRRRDKKVIRLCGKCNSRKDKYIREMGQILKEVGDGR